MTTEIRKILNHYGIEHQKSKSIEELSELIRAISRNDSKNIMEEIADVEIMIEQLKLIYWLTPEEIQDIKKQKIEKALFEIRSVNP